MPITFTIEPESDLLISTASGIIDLAEILAFLQRKQEAGVMHTPELFDGRTMTVDLSIADLHALSAEVRRIMAGTKIPRTAVVTTSNFIYGLARMYAVLAADTTPNFEIFKDVQDARDWLASQPMTGAVQPH